MQPTVRHILASPYSLSKKITCLSRFFKWQFTDKVLHKSMVFRFTPNSKLMLLRGFHALSGNYYFGISDTDIMPFLLHFLQPGDLFVDIGANGGSFTVLASAERKAKTISIEAAADTFEGLLKNIAVNNMQHLVEALNVAVSDVNGTLSFTTGPNASNRVSLEKNRTDLVSVQAKTLDNILNGRVPLLMKLDIEGHEHNAFIGAKNTLASPACVALIVEFSNTGEYYGYGNRQTHELLLGYGYAPFKYDYKNKELISFDPMATEFEFNMIYIKDEGFVNERLQKAQRIQMGGMLV